MTRARGIPSFKTKPAVLHSSLQTPELRSPMLERNDEEKKAVKTRGAALVVLLVSASTADAIGRPASFSTIGSDPAGDHNGMSHIDITAVAVRRRATTLDVRFTFVDLQDDLRAASGLRWDLGYRGRRYCCTIRIRGAGPTTQYEFTYWKRCRGCGRATMSIDGRYSSENDTMTVSVPLERTPLRIGDVISGCGFTDEGQFRRCSRSYSGCTSPGMYGYDCFTVPEMFAVR